VLDARVGDLGGGLSLAPERDLLEADPERRSERDEADREHGQGRHQLNDGEPVVLGPRAFPDPSHRVSDRAI
jgi:hypothetical protein